MSEKALQRLVVAKFRGLGHECQRFEDKFSAGIPDMAVDLGKTVWLELKYSDKPAKQGRVQQLPHFTVEQRRFLSSWPDAWLLWRIGDHHLLFDRGFELLGHVGFGDLLAECRYFWEGPPNWELMTVILSKHGLNATK